MFLSGVTLSSVQARRRSVTALRRNTGSDRTSPSLTETSWLPTSASLDGTCANRTSTDQQSLLRDLYIKWMRSKNMNAGLRSLRMNRTMPRVPYRGPGMQEYVFIDLMQRLNKDRIIFLGEEIDEEVANQTVALLLQMKEEDAVSPVNLYCQIPGGIFTAGMMIYDCMKNLPFDIVTLNMGMAAGMGAFLVAGGTKGKRFALPNARFLFQQPSLLDDFEGSAEDIKTEVLNVLRQRDQWLRHLSEFTGHPIERITEDFRRDRYFTASEAREYGLIDRVLEPTMKGMTKEMKANL